jgi:1-aminocyclopropane-1-carboxylate deaminase/D-cysteine desulfhydrase-like pyridoxal-dependent ACC family enzyme
LDALPRLGLVGEPTPLTFASRHFSVYGGPQLLFKRDDLLPVAFGGNKVRSLDLIGAEALCGGADTLVTGAGPLSNHIRATAGVAALTRLRFVAVHWGTAPERVEGNHLLTRMLGAEIRFTNNFERASVDSAIRDATAEIAARGGHPYSIPRGGACPLAALAHALAVRETLGQCETVKTMPQVVIMAAGGGATLAGWLLGTALFGAQWRLEAFAVSRPAVETLARARKLAAEAAAVIGYAFDGGVVEIYANDNFLGAGYGIPSPEGQHAIAATARAEGVFLDPTYTGKAMAGYLELLSRGRYADTGAVLFLHTGGAPSLFTATVEAML